MARLVLLHDAEKQFQLSSSPAVIGRHADAEISINRPDVSRRHARVTCDDGQYFVEDLGSSNGTFVNGLRVEARTAIKRQDVLRVGHCELLFDGAAEQESEPVIQAELSTASGNRSIFEQDAASKLTAVMDIAHHLAQARDVDELLGRLVERLFVVFPKADRGLVILREGQRLVVRAVRARGAAARVGDIFSRSVIRRVLDEGLAIMASENSPGDEPPPEGQTLVAAGIRTFVCVPLKWRDGPVRGALQLDCSHARSAFTQDDLHLLTAVALHVSAVLETTALHTQLLQHERLKRDIALARLGQLAAGVAHEVNNPLAFVLNNVSVLQRDLSALARLIKLYKLTEPVVAQAQPTLLEPIHALADEIDLAYTVRNADDLLARSRDGLKRIQQIVKDLRSFARLDESEVDEIDLNASLEACIGIASGLAERRGIKIRFERGSLPRLPCQASRVNQAVFNLLANAIDASPAGGNVTVRTEARDDSVIIHVIDHGQGIDPAVRDKIFDPFFTTKPLGKGVGLGLSITHGIISDHGGAIEVLSQPGQGAHFTVRLPLSGPRLPQGSTADLRQRSAPSGDGDSMDSR